MSAESKLWDPPPKNGAQGSDREDWQQLLKYFHLFLSDSPVLVVAMRARLCVKPLCVLHFRNLYERIIVLEQENRELSIAMSNQKNQLAAMCLRNCNGVYIWRLASFREKLAAMINDPLKMFYSPGFYTSPNEYKICARINISSKDSDYLSLVLHIMKSENDDTLDWPFKGAMYFVLIHPRSSEKNIREITWSMPDVEAFRKPTYELNKRSFGYTEFVRICDVADFLQDDSLVFRIEVRASSVFDKFKVSKE